MSVLQQPVVGHEAHVLLGGLMALHDAPDLPAFAAALPRAIADALPFDAIGLIGAVGAGAASATMLDHRLAIRTPGGGRTLEGLVLERRRPFAAREVALGGLLGPHLGAAADHVRLRQLERERTGGLRVLTDRELQVLARVAEGCTDRDIAGDLRIGARTVEKHVEHIRAKLGVRSRAEAAARWAGAAAPAGRPLGR